MSIFNDMFAHNSGLYAHIFFGGLGARLFSLVTNKFKSFVYVLIIAMSFEIFEVFIDGTSKTYGTVLRWVLDSSGDIIGAVAMAIIVLWCRDK